MVLIESNGDIRWSVKTPFKVHSINYNNGILAALAAHGFYVISTTDGSMLHDGRSTFGGFTDVLHRPGGGWILTGKEGQMHLFSHEGVGIKRFQTGKFGDWWVGLIENIFCGNPLMESCCVVGLATITQSDA